MRLERGCALALLIALGWSHARAAPDLAARVRAHARAGEWSAVIGLLPAPTGDPDLDYVLGLALARLERRREAEEAFESRYWNRTGKPRIESIRSDPRPRVDPVLLDRAFACAPASTLDRGEYRATRDALGMLGVFASSKLELTARPDGAFDLVLRPVERAGLGSGALEAIATIARGLPYRTAYFDLLNLRGAAVNLISLVRWDPSSRRAAAELSRPLRGDPRKRLEVRLDARRERWRLPASSDFTLQSVGGEAAFRALGRGGWGWSSGAALAHRRFGDPPREAASFEDGPLLCWRAGGSGPILAIPERRFEMRASSSFEVGRVLTGTRGVFAQLGAGIAWQWLPRARGEAGRIAGSLRAGRTAGEAPFDALYDLGLDRDRDLALRGHAGTRAGHKGTGPRGRDYILASAELDAVTLRAGLVEMALGPFLDAARVGRLLSGTPHGWLVDAGVQTRLRVAGSVGVVLSYGRDLRQGRGAFFATTSR